MALSKSREARCKCLNWPAMHSFEVCATCSVPIPWGCHDIAFTTRCAARTKILVSGNRVYVDRMHGFRSPSGWYARESCPYDAADHTCGACRREPSCWKHGHLPFQCDTVITLSKGSLQCMLSSPTRARQRSGYQPLLAPQLRNIEQSQHPNRRESERQVAYSHFLGRELVGPSDPVSTSFNRRASGSKFELLLVVHVRHTK